MARLFPLLHPLLCPSPLFPKVRRSEFWAAVDDVFGPTLGRSMAADLYLPSLGATAQAAIESGCDPDHVWAALVEETGRGPQVRWIHRIDPKDRRQRQ